MSGRLPLDLFPYPAARGLGLVLNLFIFGVKNLVLISKASTKWG
jgi:hypothetical protein